MRCSRLSGGWGRGCTAQRCRCGWRSIAFCHVHSSHLIAAMASNHQPPHYRHGMHAALTTPILPSGMRPSSISSVSCGMRHVGHHITATWHSPSISYPIVGMWHASNSHLNSMRGASATPSLASGMHPPAIPSSPWHACNLPITVLWHTPTSHLIVAMAFAQHLPSHHRHVACTNNQPP